MGPLQLLVLQPTAFCNLDCDYCYLPDRTRRSRMELATVQAAATFAAQLGAQNEIFRILWHVGEPLVVPPDWYRSAHQVLSEVLGANRIELHFQTNATLLTPAWISFLRSDPRIRLGISLDGPAHLNDAHRRTRSGHGTYAKVMTAIEAVRQAGIPFNVIAVITADTLDHADELYDFFRELEPELLALNPEEMDGQNSCSSLRTPHNELRYRRFLRRFAERVLQDKFALKVREFVRIEAQLRQFGRSTPAPLTGNRTNSPWAILSVDWKGNLHTFSPELLGTDLPGVGTSLGSVLTDTPAEISLSPRFKRLVEEIERGIRKCRETCDYFRCCGGGSPSNKWGENGSFSSSETSYCRLTVKASTDEYLAAAADSAASGPALSR